MEICSWEEVPYFGRHGHDENAEVGIADAMQDECGRIPEWAIEIRNQMPAWGFESCTHDWLNGLEALLRMIEYKKSWPRPGGCCGDVPLCKRWQYDLRLSALRQWIYGENGDPNKSILFDSEYSRIKNKLGERTEHKAEAAKLLEYALNYAGGVDEETLRALLAESDCFIGEDGPAWEKDTKERLFVLLTNPAGHRMTDTIDALFDYIGGKKEGLRSNTYACRDNLLGIYAADPARREGSYGMIVGIKAFLEDRNLSWLEENYPCYIFSADRVVYSMRSIDRDEDHSIQRWLLCCLFVTVKHEIMEIDSIGLTREERHSQNKLPVLERERVSHP